MRCEKVYRRFFIPRLRGDASPDGRGRGKGYAGLLLLPGDATEVEVRGMEAVRSDSTPLARRFQLELLRRLFGGDGEAGLRAFGRDTAARLPRGELDGELVYRKALRRPAEADDLRGLDVPAEHRGSEGRSGLLARDPAAPSPERDGPRRRWPVSYGDGGGSEKDGGRM
jgi:DNA polymerase elongation subunit (family B)